MHNNKQFSLFIRVARPILCSCLLLVALARSASAALEVKPTDSVDSLNAKIRSLAEEGGGEVHFPAGIYTMDAPLLLGDNITVRGDGPGAVLIASDRFDEFLVQNKVYGDAPDINLFFSPKSDYVGMLNVRKARGVRVSGITLRGSREKVRALMGVLVHDSEDVSIRDVTIEDCGSSGLVVLRSHDVPLSEIRSRRNHNGIMIAGPAASTHTLSVTNCRVSDNRWSGIYLCGEGSGADKARNGPADVIISNNFIYRHLCDEGIKCFGLSDAIITGNRVDFALEAGVSVDGQDLVVANNICTHVDDGMDNKGNGVAFPYSNRSGDKLNAVIHGNIARNCNSGIWSEDFRRVGDKQLPIGRVAVVGNVSVDNVTAGIGHIMKTDVACVGNVCVDNGHSQPDPSSPAETNMGIMVGGGTHRTTLMGNVISDDRDEAMKRLMYGLVLRGCDDGFAAYNYVSGCKLENVKQQAPGKNYLHEKNGEVGR